MNFVLLVFSCLAIIANVLATVFGIKVFLKNKKLNHYLDLTIKIARERFRKIYFEEISRIKEGTDDKQGDNS